MKYWKSKRIIAKIFKYEYWPFYIFFMPLIPVWIYYAIRNKSLVYFTAVNPGIYLSGLFGESKKDILIHIPDSYLPKMVYLKPGLDYRSVSLIMLKNHISYPIIMKPDVGERGTGVEKIEDEGHLATYLKCHPLQKLILQEYVDYEYEFGIFYYRYPDGSSSGISSIAGKKFLSVIGDGTKSLGNLIKSDLRASMHYERLYIKFKDSMHRVLDLHEELLLEPIGNHCKGTTFLNYTHLANSRLVKVFDKIANEFEGFYFGRFDIKVKSVDDLYEGKNIKVMEVNGVTSEPAHIYDPSYSLFHAYRDVAKNMKICADIAYMNHNNGIPYLDTLDILIHLKSYFIKNDNHTQQPCQPILADSSH